MFAVCEGSISPKPFRVSKTTLEYIASNTSCMTERSKVLSREALHVHRCDDRHLLRIGKHLGIPHDIIRVTYTIVSNVSYLNRAKLSYFHSRRTRSE